MKKSNKMLLITTCSLFILLSFPQWVIYQRFKNRQLNTKQADPHNEVKLQMASPRYLSIKGLYIASIISSDTFAIEYSKVDDGDPMIYGLNNVSGDGQEAERHAAPRYYRHGDTLIINGLDTVSGKSITGKPRVSKAAWVRVYCRDLDLIQLQVPKAYLQGDSQRIPSTFRFALNSTDLEVGSTYPLKYFPSKLIYNLNHDDMPYYSSPIGYEYPKALYYDSLSVSLSNTSSVSLDVFCEIKKCNLQFIGNGGLLTDQGATLGKFTAIDTGQNKYSLTSANLQKLTITRTQ